MVTPPIKLSFALGLILAFLPYFPYTKHAHLFMGPFNFMTRPQRVTPGALAPIDEQRHTNHRTC